MSRTNIIVFVTAKDRAQARKMSQHLLKQKLVACVNLLPGVESHFWWQGKLDQAKEVLMVIKTRKVLFAKIVKAIQKVHSYQVPEIIALPIVAGEEKYLKWLNQETRL